MHIHERKGRRDGEGRRAVERSYSSNIYVGTFIYRMIKFPTLPHPPAVLTTKLLLHRQTEVGCER